ncbi:MAG: cytochrome c biogenesis protein ResB [Elusimicrobia bacterium]|nr:cytochrome c biogenesis protein ResB [Elusimicrobiota bacterium]
MRDKNVWRRLAHALSSLELTLACLALLMVLVTACTLLQVPLGTHRAVQSTVRSPLGGLVGGVLLANLLFAQFRRLEFSRRKLGLWLAHLGLALLFVGEFGTALFQVESQMPLEIGQTKDYSEDDRRTELTATDASDPRFDVVTAIPDSRLKRGGEIDAPALPFTLSARRYHENAELGMRRPSDPPSEATAGIGPNLLVRPAPPSTSDDARDSAAILVEAKSRGGRGLGTFWLSSALGAPQGFSLDGRTWRLALRPRRYRLPFSLTLEEFRHDVYPGTDIPKNFSSRVRLRDPGRGEDRAALISMNNPLRYGGKAFYQASFGQNDRLSVLQVVRNPGWLLPYAACALIAAGILLHFGLKLRASLGARP